MEFCKRRRAQLGITQEVVVSRIGGYTRQWLVKFEAGGQKGIKEGMLPRLAVALELDEEILQDVFNGHKVTVRRDGTRYSELPEMTREIPILTTLIAGEGSPLNGFVYVGYSDTVRRNLRAVRVNSTSMGPEIMDGDVVVFDANEIEPSNGQLVVITMAGASGEDGSGVVTRWYATPDEVRLIPNTGPTLRMRPDEVKVHGVVFEIRRRLA